MDKLSAFESIVQRQRPASKPWEPVTDYSYESRKAVEGAHAELIVTVFRPFASILDVGCGNGHLLRMLTEVRDWPDLRCTLRGCDKNADGVTYSRFDVTKDDPARLGKSQLVICREVLEHLTILELTKAVRNLVALSSRYIYVTTRFTAKPDLLDVDTCDDLDPTHITLLNRDLLRLLFVIEGCTRRGDMESVLDWKHLGRVLVYETPRP